MNEKGKKMCKVLFAVLFCGVLLLSGQVCAADYSCEVSIPVEVAVTGENIPEGRYYQVVLEAVTKGAPVPEKSTLTVRNGEKAEFGPIAYGIPEDYQYRIYQKCEEEKGFSYDKSIYLVTVRVINDEKGGLKAEVWAVKEGSKEKLEKLRFENKYRLPGKQEDPSETFVERYTVLTRPKTGDGTDVVFWMSCALVSMMASLVMVGKWTK